MKTTNIVCKINTEKKLKDKKIKTLKNYFYDDSEKYSFDILVIMLTESFRSIKIQHFFLKFSAYVAENYSLLQRQPLLRKCYIILRFYFGFIPNTYANGSEINLTYGLLTYNIFFLLYFQVKY